MITKINRFLKIFVVCELVILGVMMVTRYYSPEANASYSFMAHNSTEPEAFVITVTSIMLDAEDGEIVCVWQGQAEMDLAQVTSLAEVATISGTIPVKKYTRLQFVCEGFKSKVKGSVVVSSVTYYTKASHTNFTQGPAELEEMNPMGSEFGDGFYLEQHFSPAIELGGDISKVRVLINLSYLLMYYDGVSATSGGSVPLGAEGTPAGMYMNNPQFALTFGEPGSKEEYIMSTPSDPANPGKGLLTLLFDAGGNAIGVSSNKLFVDNLPENLYVYGFAGTGYSETGLSTDCFAENGDGTYRITLDQLPSKIVFTNFQRQNHSGHVDILQGGTTMQSETYQCVINN